MFQLNSVHRDTFVFPRVLCRNVLDKESCGGLIAAAMKKEKKKSARRISSFSAGGCFPRFLSSLIFRRVFSTHVCSINWLLSTNHCFLEKKSFNFVKNLSYNTRASFLNIEYFSTRIPSKISISRFHEFLFHHPCKYNRIFLRILSNFYRMLHAYVVKLRNLIGKQNEYYSCRNFFNNKK